MPYGLISKVSEDGREFHMRCSEGNIRCRLSRTMFKRQKIELKRNMIVTVDVDDNDETDSEVPRQEPWKIVHLDTLQKTIILATGTEELVADIRKNLKYNHIKVFENITKKKNPEIRLVTETGKVFTYSDLPSKIKRMAPIYNEIVEAARNGTLRNNAINASSSERAGSCTNDRVSLTDATLHKFSNDELNSVMVTQSGTIAALRAMIEGRLQTVQTSASNFIRDPTASDIQQKLNEPSQQFYEQYQSPPQQPIGLLAQLDAREASTRTAVTQLATFLPENMSRNGLFQITDREGNILRNVDQLRSNHALTISQGQSEYTLRNHPTPGQQHHGAATAGGSAQ